MIKPYNDINEKISYFRNCNDGAKADKQIKREAANQIEARQPVVTVDNISKSNTIEVDSTKKLSNGKIYNNELTGKQIAAVSIENLLHGDCAKSSHR